MASTGSPAKGKRRKPRQKSSVLAEVDMSELQGGGEGGDAAFAADAPSRPDPPPELPPAKVSVAAPPGLMDLMG